MRIYLSKYHISVNVSLWLWACLIISALLMAGCSSGNQTNIITDVPAPPRLTVHAGWDHMSEGATWTKDTLQALDRHGQGLLTGVPDDIAQYCPAYPGLEIPARRAFWVHLLSSLAKFESNYKPGVKFDETTVDPKMLTREGTPIYSRGLLQISRESANGYGCNIKDAKELHQPGVNIACAVRIFNRWIVKDKMISGRVKGKWKGAARYFSPFRDDRKLQSLRGKSKQLAICQ